MAVGLAVSAALLLTGWLILRAVQRRFEAALPPQWRVQDAAGLTWTGSWAGTAALAAGFALLWMLGFELRLMVVLALLVALWATREAVYEAIARTERVREQHALTPLREQLRAPAAWRAALVTPMLLMSAGGVGVLCFGTGLVAG